jgi:hypothetical protein
MFAGVSAVLAVSIIRAMKEAASTSETSGIFLPDYTAQKPRRQPSS